MHRPPIGNKNRGVRPDKEFVVTEEEHQQNKAYRVNEADTMGLIKYVLGLLISVGVITLFVWLMMILVENIN